MVMVYNFNLGIGWASSGVEYAQAYRAQMLRNIGVDAKFVFTDMFARDNIQHMTENIGFKDSEIIWLYTYFTDTKIAPVSYTLKQLEATFGDKKFTFSRKGKTAKYVFDGKNNFYTVYMVDEKSDRVHRVEIVSRGSLIRKDYFTYCRIYSEYYAPLDHQAHLYQRRFFNEDGTVAYEEIIDDDIVMYRFPDRLLCSKEEFVGYMVERLNLTEDDVVIIDRTTGIGQAILRNATTVRIIADDNFYVKTVRRGLKRAERPGKRRLRPVVRNDDTGFHRTSEPGWRTDALRETRSIPALQRRTAHLPRPQGLAESPPPAWEYHSA